jgi:hypothetical protein
VGRLGRRRQRARRQPRRLGDDRRLHAPRADPAAAAPGRQGAARREKVWYDDAACLDVAFDPQPAQASANAKDPGVGEGQAKDGADVSSPFDAEAIAGRIAPARGRPPRP